MTCIYNLLKDLQFLTYYDQILSDSFNFLYNYLDIATGDFNDDSDTNILDIIILVNHILNPNGVDLEGADINNDNDLLEWVKATAETTYHPVGTCKMGQDNMSVVDEKLIVNGLLNLRVVDASVMPTLTSGNTNAPTIMIAEKASDLILSKWN